MNGAAHPVLSLEVGKAEMELDWNKRDDVEVKRKDW